MNLQIHPLLIVLLLIFPLHSELNAAESRQVSDKVDVYLPVFPPYVIDRGTNLSGLIPDLIAEIFASSDQSFKLHPSSFAKNLKLFERAKTPVFFGNLSLLTRATKFETGAFAYYELISDRYVVIYNKESMGGFVDDIVQLKGKTLILTRGSDSESRMGKLAGAIEYAVDSESLFRMLVRGRADFSVVTEVTLKQYFKKDPLAKDRITALPEAFPLSLGLVVRKNDVGFCDLIRKNYTQFIESDNYHKIMSKHFQLWTEDELKDYLARPDLTSNSCDY